MVQAILDLLLVSPQVSKGLDSTACRLQELLQTTTAISTKYRQRYEEQETKSTATKTKEGKESSENKPRQTKKKAQVTHRTLHIEKKMVHSWDKHSLPSSSSPRMKNKESRARGGVSSHPNPSSTALNVNRVFLDPVFRCVNQSFLCLLIQWLIYLRVLISFINSVARMFFFFSKLKKKIGKLVNSQTDFESF